MFQDVYRPIEAARDEWAELSRANRGIPEVDVRWLANNMDSVRALDIRQPDELVGPLGHIPEIEHIPMAQVPGEASRWDKDDKLVIVCRSGGRSGRIALMLEARGFQHVASLAGGMLDWNEAGLPVSHRR